MNKISSIVVDDELSNREIIKSLVPQLNDRFIVSGEADNVQEGYDLIRKIKPDVVFLDIRMPGGSGFDLLKLFDEITFQIVFVTGFDEYALKAFEYNALDYVLKPVNIKKFSETLNKIQLRMMTNFSNFDNLKSIIQTYDTDNAIITKIPIHHNDGVILLDMQEILYIQAIDGCTCFYLSGAEKHISAKQLSDFTFIIDNFPNFLRINKGTFININFITRYSKGFDCTITMKNGITLEISRRKKTQILNLISHNKKLG